MIGRRLGIAALLTTLAATVAADPSLTVAVGGRTAIYTAAGLLVLPKATTVTIPADVAYKRSMSFRAVPIAALLDGVASDESIRFTAADGFVATFPVAALLAREGPVAYLAVEPPDAPWPPLKAGEAGSAGPFYLVWTSPDKSVPASEQWPYRIVRIEGVASLAKRFPMIVPAARLATNDPIRVGFAAFQKHCMVCHTLNGGGDATLGPDLNISLQPDRISAPGRAAASDSRSAGAAPLAWR